MHCDNANVSISMETVITARRLWHIYNYMQLSKLFFILTFGTWTKNKVFSYNSELTWRKVKVQLFKVKLYSRIALCTSYNNTFDLFLWYKKDFVILFWEGTVTHGLYTCACLHTCIILNNFNSQTVTKIIQNTHTCLKSILNQCCCLFHNGHKLSIKTLYYANIGRFRFK